MSEFDGWARTTVRCRQCGGEVATVYGTAAGLMLMGPLAIGGSRILVEDDRDPIASRCPKCGREGTADPVELRRAARTGRCVHCGRLGTQHL